MRPACSVKFSSELKSLPPAKLSFHNPPRQPIDKPTLTTYHAPFPPATLGEKPSGQVAQLVEHWTENPGVAGSIPALSTL